NRRCAWDCVITAEKSVSVAALCSSEFRSVQAAFRIAVMRLLYHLESLAYRQDNAGTGIAQPTGNLIAAKYVHEASRHSDPHVHAHLLLINATYGTSGKDRDRRWRSLEPANIYRNQTALRWVFNAELHRQFASFGLRSAIDAEGITRLPSAEEKAHLTELLVDHKIRPIPLEQPPGSRARDSLPAIPPPPPRSFQDPEFHVEQARELLGKALAKTSLYFSPQTMKLTTCRVAAAHPDLPLGVFARAAHWWS